MPRLQSKNQNVSADVLLGSFILLFCFVLFFSLCVCVCVCATKVTLTNLDIMHVVYFRLLLKSQELRPHSPGQ